MTDKSAAYLAAYDAVLERWPVEVTPIDVPSAYGTTRVNACGPQDAPPLVLLHGGGATSTVWFANVADLARTHRVFAVDGDGRSIHNGAPIATAVDFMAWLDAVLSGLGVESTALCGHSYGAWQALGYALHARERVTKLVLLDPTDCFAPMSLSYRLHAVPFLLRPNARRWRQFLAWETGGAKLDPAWLNLTALGAEQPRSRIVMPRRPAPARFAGFTVPTLLVLAERSRVHDIRLVEANARRVLPHVVTAVLPAATHHTIPTENAGAIDRILLDFLS